MLNIIQADLFKIRKGKALKGVMLGLLLIVLITAAVFKLVESPAFQVTMENNGEIFSSDDLSDVEEAQGMMPQNGGDFVRMMFLEVGSGFVLFLLVFIITIFGVDYSSGTYRNLLSYHSSRGSIYAAKVITNTILTIVMLIGFLVLNVIIGGILFGFGGFSAALFLTIIKGFLLTMPILIAFITLGHCIVAFSKRTSYAIAIYLVGLIVWSLVLQIPAMLIPRLEWLMQLDLMSAPKLVAQYAVNGSASIAVPMIFSIILIVGTYVLGLARYKTTDFDFS